MAQRVRFERFVLNRKTVARIAVGPECRDMCNDAAQRARAVAVSFSPRSADPDGVHYADSFEVEDVIVVGITAEHPMNRAGSRLYNTSDYATEVEWGKTGPGGYKGHGVFSRTLAELAAMHQAGPT